MVKTIVKVYEFVTRRQVVITLALIVSVAFILRTVLPMRTVFGYGFVNFLEVDAYNRMWYANNIQAMPFFEGFTYAVQNGLLFSWVIAILGNILPIELVGAWLPPILGAGVVILMYFIGSNVFNKFVGLTAALFVAIIPSEFYHRSLLGFADHHVMEVFLMALIIYLIIKSTSANRLINRYVFIAGGMLFLYLANWTGGFLLIILFAIMIILVILQGFVYKTEWKKTVYAYSIITVIGVALYLGLGGFSRYFYWLPWLARSGSAELTHAAGLASEVSTTIFMPIAERTTSELMPLLAPFGKFDIGVVITNLHLFTFTFVLGLYFIWRWRKDSNNLLIIVWTLLLLVITLNQRRFMYYFTLPVGLLSAWGIYVVGQKFKRFSHTIMILSITTLILCSLPFIQAIGYSNVYSMSPEWHQALEWLEEQPDKGKVTAWSDYGHWIQYTADKTPSLLPSPGGKDVAVLFLTDDDIEAQELLEKLGTGYLIIDSLSITYKLRALEIESGRELTDDSFALRLFMGRKVPYLDLAYASERLRIYEYTTN